MMREVKLSPKQQELYDKLLEKSEAGRISWKMQDTYMYAMESHNFRVVIRQMGIEGKYPLVVQRNVLILHEGQDLLTSFEVFDNKLFHSAEQHCPERIKALEEVIAYLEKL